MEVGVVDCRCSGRRHQGVNAQVSPTAATTKLKTATALTKTTTFQPRKTSCDSRPIQSALDETRGALSQRAYSDRVVQIFPPPPPPAGNSRVGQSRKKVSGDNPLLFSPHPVLGEHAALPLGGEGVEREVEREQHHAARHATTLLLLAKHVGPEINSLGGVLWWGVRATGTHR